MPTQAVPGSTAGTAQVLEGISCFNNLDRRAMIDKVQSRVRDLGSVLLLPNLIYCQKRDREKS